MMLCELGMYIVIIFSVKSPLPGARGGGTCALGLLCLESKAGSLGRLFRKGA